ncbi:hypothetical protein C2E23DRAFT_832895 [Lenzites betulinus]|nr:hypothetical protein C2E23DRAFT_832895 [Lenzites betulinus]
MCTSLNQPNGISTCMEMVRIRRCIKYRVYESLRVYGGGHGDLCGRPRSSTRIPLSRLP